MSDFLAQADFFSLVFGAALVVVAVVLVVMLASMLAGDEKRVRRRVARVAAGQSAAESAAGTPPSLRRNETDSSIASFDRLIKRVVPNPAKMRERLAATGRRISIGEYVLASLLVGALAFSVRVLIGGVPLAAAILFGIGMALGVPHMVVGFLIKRRRNRFMMLLPEGIDLIVRGLRSGLPITESIKVVGQEIPDPVGIEFRRIVESFAVGLTLEQALWAAADRIGVPEFRFFVISLTVQQETGGNLTETLENLGNILRRRKQVKLKIRALTGEARASAMILGLLPFIMFGALMLIRPEYGMVMLTTQRGHLLLGAGLLSMSVGIGTMIRMTKFEI